MADAGAAASSAEFDPSQRRLDSLARCLEDGQECVAVVCIIGEI